MNYYWKGDKNFPTEAGTLEYTNVWFDAKETTLTIAAEDKGEYLITGIDDMWLAVEAFRGTVIPVKLSDLPAAENGSYNIEGTSALAVLKKFDKNVNTIDMLSKMKRTTY